MIVNKFLAFLLFRTVCDLRQSRQQHSTWHIAQLSSIPPTQNAKPEIDPTLAERQSDAAQCHDWRVGSDAELTTLRCAKLMMLALRGFERPCALARLSVAGVGTFKSEHPGT